MSKRFTQLFPGKQEPPKEAGTAILLRTMENLNPWQIRSVEGFRNVLTGQGGLMANPLISFGDTNDEIAAMVQSINETVKAGRMIDFGYVPNEMIKAESLRAREAFEAGELAMSFDSWVAVSRWEGGHCAYLFIEPPKGIRKLTKYGDRRMYIGVEMYGVSIPAMPGMCEAHNSLVLYDGMTAGVKEIGDTKVWPFPFADERSYHMTSTRDQELRGSNCLDPLVTFLRFLNDAGCPVNRMAAPGKLNAARAKNGKPPIPGHYSVPAHDYVTRLRLEEATSRNLQNGRQGGTHASPAPHWRRGHKRHLRSGTVVDVRASKVNFRSVDEMHRLFYTAKLPNGGIK